MGLLGWLKEQRRVRRELCRVLDLACAACRAGGAQHLIRSMSRIVHTDDDRWIVQVCHGDTRPPHRSFFSVSRVSLEVTPMTEEEVGRSWRVPIWR